MLFKTIPVPDRGVNYALKPHALDPRSWFTLDGFRTLNGTITSFAGFESLVPNGVGGANFNTYGTLLREFQQDSGVQHLIAGDVNKIHKVEIPAYTLTDLTGDALLGPTRDEPWMAFAYAGNIYFTNIIDGLWRWPGFGPIINVPSAPKARSGALLSDYICLLNTIEEDGPHPSRFKWSSEGLDNDWVAANNNDAGDFDLFDTPDFGVALYRMGNDLVAYKERTIVPITFIGGNEVFGRRAAVAGIGLLGQYGLINMTDKHVFMGQEAFYSYAGGNVADDSFGDAIRDKVYGELHETYRNRVRALYLRQFLELFFAYPDKNSLGACNKAVIFNMKDGTWYGPITLPREVSMTGAYDAFRASTPLDLMIYEGAGLYQVGSIFTHNGEPITRTMESGDHNLQTDCTDENGNRVFHPLSAVYQVDVINIELDNIDSAADGELWVAGRLDLNDPLQWQGPYPIESFSAQTIRVPVRCTGRWFRFKIVTNASTKFTLLGYQFAEYAKVGER